MNCFVVIRFTNGNYGVKDIRDGVYVTGGMTLKQASEYADRRNLRMAWGK